jgi:ABC-type multidrug transport system ATPase subunit
VPLSLTLSLSSSPSLHSSINCFSFSVADRKTKTLNKGQLRRLTIAEELVHGPNLVLIDEPITGLDVKDAAVIMTGTLRELVNQERTVICTMHQPSAEVFALFDTLVLLSKGRLVYMGKAEDATAFFINDPKLQFDIKEYANPADFLFDISACLIYNKMVCHHTLPLISADAVTD